MLPQTRLCFHAPHRPIDGAVIQTPVDSTLSALEVLAEFFPNALSDPVLL